jgi:Flp pilus assembly protein TadD
VSGVLAFWPGASNDFETLLAASNLAGLLLSRGDAAAALGLLREARRNAAGLARDSDVRLRLTYNIAHALCATGNHGEAEALAEENLVLQNRVYGTAHPNAAAALELVGHVRAGLAAQA